MTFRPGDSGDIHAIHLGQRGPLPTRGRSFVHFLSKPERIIGTDEVLR